MDTLADDVEWVIPYPADIPNAGTFRGKAGVMEWLGKTGDNVEFRAFEPREFIAQGATVVVLAHAEATIKRTDREIAQDVAHVVTLRDGKIVRHQAFEDTVAVVDAYRER